MLVAEIDFKFTEMPVGGAAIDAAGDPLPNETLLACKESDAVLLAAIGGYKWDNNEPHLRPERGLLGLRAGLGVFANLRPATVLPHGKLGPCFPSMGRWSPSSFSKT
ncbi:hypothetical protein SUGI_0733280 [Cryptomeria japonica]|nr:hypothetical protein SUGI_0733280 [Cryptomeria japonica]